MSVLGDMDLKTYIERGKLKIDPFSEEVVRENGLDLRLGGEIARLRNVKEVFELGKSRL